MQALLARLRARLVDDWRSAWRWWSTWMHVAGTAAAGLLLLTPSMPAEVQALVPVQYRALAIGAWAVAGLLARLVKQNGR